MGRVWLAMLLAGCSWGGSDDGGVEDLGSFDGKADAIATRTVHVAPGATKWYRVKAVEYRATFAQTGDVDAQLSAKAGSIEMWSEPGTAPALDVDVADDVRRTWTIRVANLGDADLDGTLSLHPLPLVVSSGLPTLSDPVVSENDFCTYADTAPYVRSVAWNHPKVRAALRALGPGWRSTFGYSEWSVPYGLEKTSGTDTQKMRAAARNWIRILCGEHRDYPAMLERKLDLLAEAQVYAGPDEMEDVDTSANLFTQITYPAYLKMVAIMGAVHTHRQWEIASDGDGYHYGFGEVGHGSNRVDQSVPPWTHCEMKYMFERWMTADAPEPDAEAYVAGYDEYRSSCAADDFAWMYNFRGHKNFQPLWLESNAFVWNARRARGAETSRGDRSYYLRPFASRYARARAAWGTYLLYPDADHDAMIRASEYGGGPILYVTDQDGDGNGLADYRLFDQDGCGDQGVSTPNPGPNCNMVEWDVAWEVPNTTGAASGWERAWAVTPDMGFLRTFSTFEDRMARFNQALDRHTNWGPTSYYMLDASAPSDTSPRFMGAYSPIVACSYDISASNSFATGDYPSTPAFESGRTKWMYVMRFRAADYYDESAMREGRPIDFDRHYFNETSLSNDYYVERALDRFGWVPLADMHANVYFVYGARGEAPPELVDIPAP